MKKVTEALLDYSIQTDKIISSLKSVKNKGQITLGYSPVVEKDKKQFINPLKFDHSMRNLT
jgi:hypothetical protein